MSALEFALVWMLRADELLLVHKNVGKEVHPTDVAAANNDFVSPTESDNVEGPTVTADTWQFGPVDEDPLLSLPHASSANAETGRNALTRMREIPIDAPMLSRRQYSAPSRRLPLVSGCHSTGGMVLKEGLVMAAVTSFSANPLGVEKRIITSARSMDGAQLWRGAGMGQLAEP
jgi:hypothetical protein